MGMFDWLTGAKGNAPGIAPKSTPEVREALLAINRTTAPFVVRDGAPEGVDLVVEWRIVDAAWRDFFGRAGLKESFRIFMRLDETKHEVRTKDELRSVEWSSGVPMLGKSVQTGQIHHKAGGRGFAFTEEGEYGKVYEYRFSSTELKTPLKEAVARCGWRWHGIAFGKV